MLDANALVGSPDDPAFLDEIRVKRDRARDEVKRQKTLMREFFTAAEGRSNDGQIRHSDSREFDRMQRELERLEDDADAFGSRYEELRDKQDRKAVANEARHTLGGQTGGFVVTATADVYRPNAGRGEPNYFRDLLLARNGSAGSVEAAERLSRQNQISLEQRSVDLVSNIAGQGQELAPPAWLVSRFVALARPGRTAADLSVSATLPQGVSSLNIPKISGGSATGVQNPQGATVSDVQMTTTSVSTSITTIAGKQLLSNQIIYQTPVDITEIVLTDLASDYAKQLDAGVITGTGASGTIRGLKQVATSVSYTTTQPALTSTTSANSFYNVVLKASAAVNTTRFAPADSILMTPQRWAWCLSQLDTTTRPIIGTGGQSFNSVAVSQEVRAEGSVGTLAGLNVFIDSQVPTTVSTNQDVVFVLRSSDLYLWESPLALDTFNATYADSNSTLVRAVGYVGYIPDRYVASVQMITGTGLVTTQYL